MSTLGKSEQHRELERFARAWAAKEGHEPGSFVAWVRQAADQLNDEESSSLCVECDAKQGECDHSGRRYLDPVEYERTKAGWRIPAAEQPRWDDNRHLRSHGQWPTGQNSPAPKTPALLAVTAKIEQVAFMDEQLQSLIRDAYQENPHQTSLLVDDVHQQAKQGRLNHPGGLLAKRLKQLIG